MKYQTPVDMIKAHYQDYIDTGDGTFQDAVNFSASSLMTVLSTCYAGDHDKIVTHLMAIVKGVRENPLPTIPTASIH